MKRIAITLAAAVVAVIGAQAQEKERYMVVTKADNSTVEIPVGKVKDITFTEKEKNQVFTEVFTVEGVSFTMIKVVGGTFQMGESADDNHVTPIHSVTLSDYYIGETEVTQELWQAVMGSNPSKFSGAKRPVEYVSWNDCQTFIQKLNQLTGQNFRLPTEAEWEFAAKGGTQSQGYTYSGSNTIGDVAWYNGNSGETSHDVGTKSPNELGIYDMSGNVWEWCQDWYGDYSSSSQTNPTGPSSGSHRVGRGGSWDLSTKFCRSANRNNSLPTYRNYLLGLRIAL